MLLDVNARHLTVTVKQDGRYFSVTRMSPLVAAGRAATCAGLRGLRVAQANRQWCRAARLPREGE